MSIPTPPVVRTGIITVTNTKIDNIQNPNTIQNSQIMTVPLVASAQTVPPQIAKAYYVSSIKGIIFSSDGLEWKVINTI